MTGRRAVLLGLGGLALAGAGFAAGGFAEARRQAGVRLFGRATTTGSRAGALEYALAGDGPPLMMIHGTGGGFDQGLLFASKLRDQGFRIVAPSRFGYLGSAFPEDASPGHQADRLVDLIDHLGIERLAVVGGSAGALSAAEFALRHPDRCSHLGLLVPAANLTGRDPVAFSALQRIAVGAVLGSDAMFWALSRAAPRQMIRTLLATDPGLLDRVSADEAHRARTILDQIFPISRKSQGLRADGYWAGAPTRTAYDRISVPTLILSCEDDLFGTAGHRAAAGRTDRRRHARPLSHWRAYLARPRRRGGRADRWVRPRRRLRGRQMRRPPMEWIVGSLGALTVALAGVIWTTSLPRAFQARRTEAAAVPRAEPKLLTEPDIAHLPPPVQRYIALTGSIGRPVVTAVTLRFNATMYDAPGSPGMAGPVVQYERFDTPERLFLMTTRMKGLPVAVLHDFDGDHATMRVRLAGLVNVVDLAGPDLTRTETVTILNDLCFFAPSRLADPRLSWTEIAEDRAGVSFALGPHTVSAELVFNAAGELVDFVSEDRGMLQKDGKLRILRWTTPMRAYRDVGGWRLASEGEAIWHRPDGPFTYGRIRLSGYDAE